MDTLCPIPLLLAMSFSRIEPIGSRQDELVHWWKPDLNQYVCGWGWVGRIVMYVCICLLRTTRQFVLISNSGQLTFPAPNHRSGYTSGSRTAWTLLTPDTLTHMHSHTHTHTHTYTCKQSRSRGQQRAWMSHYCQHRKLYLRGRGWMYESDAIVRIEHRDTHCVCVCFLCSHLCVCICTSKKTVYLNSLLTIV